MSWLPDILVYRASILPTIIGSVTVVTLFAMGVAVVSLWWGKEVGLTNNVGTYAGSSHGLPDPSASLVGRRWFATRLSVRLVAATRLQS